MKKVLALLLFATGLAVYSGCKKEEVFDAEQQLEIDVRLIDEYLSENGLVAEVDPDTQLRYIITQAGTGDNAAYGKTVEAHYTGILLDGTEFDSSEGGSAFNFVLGRRDVIEGWDIGFQFLNKGAQAFLFIPSGLAYGNSRGPNGDLPLNAVLVFSVSVIDIR